MSIEISKKESNDGFENTPKIRMGERFWKKCITKTSFQISTGYICKTLNTRLSFLFQFINSVVNLLFLSASHRSNSGFRENILK